MGNLLKRLSTLFVVFVMAVGLMAACSSESGSRPASHESTQSRSQTDTQPDGEEDSSSSSGLQSENRDAAAADPGDSSLAVDVLVSLPAKGRASKTGYSRSRFGSSWPDVDDNGCDTRNHILNRDLTDKTYEAGTNDCIVLTCVLNDPYMGKTISFQRGQDTSNAVQIDHVVALPDAWQKGAQQLFAETRVRFANDPYNLLAVDRPANSRKGDGDAAAWLPANKSFRCGYVARQIGVKHKYGLWVTQSEHDAMNGILVSCPTQAVPTDGGVITAIQATPEPAPTPAPQETQQQQSTGTDVYYPNCTAVRETGKAPLHEGDPGYSTKLDRDRDGVACK